jgi:hypothetical protein
MVQGNRIVSIYLGILCNDGYGEWECWFSVGHYISLGELGPDTFYVSIRVFFCFDGSLEWEVTM